MSQPWPEAQTPQVAPPAGQPLRWEVTSTAEVCSSRRDLRTALLSLPAGTAAAECIDELMLTFEELVSNGVRHGRGPVQVTVTLTVDGCLIDVSDAAAEAPPTPSVDRDPGSGGLGLHMVARLAAAYGWFPRHGRKHVWAVLRCPA